MRSPITAATASALVLAVAAVGCGDDDPDRLTAGDDFSIEAALAELPVPGDEGAGFTVSVFDLAAAAEANDAGERPTADEDDEVGPWLARASGVTAEDDGDLPPVFLPVAEVLGSDRAAQAEEIRSELGWSVLDVDAVAEVVAPPFRFGVVAGDLDEGTLDDATLEEVADGVVTAGEGEDEETRLDDTTPARPLGMPLRMAADDGRLAAASSTDAVAEWVDGEPATLAEEDDLRAVAAALDDAGALSAYITTLIPGVDGAGAADSPLEEPFTAVGIGWAVEDGESRIAVAYAYGSEAAAEGAADEVEAAYEAVSTADAQPVSDQLILDEVVVEGAVVVAHVRPGPGGRPQAPVRMLQGADVPFSVGQG